MQSKSIVRRKYSRNLEDSIDASSRIAYSADEVNIEPIDIWRLPQLISKANTDVAKRFQYIIKSLEKNRLSMWLKLGGLFLCVFTVFLLENLRSTSALFLGKEVKNALVDLALAVTTLQRLHRIEDSHQKYYKQKVADELMNTGHVKWTPSNQPDWLLIEVDVNILIRPIQVEIATRIMLSFYNIVLRFMMGQDKISHIMSMVESALADGKKLVRVVIPRALLF